MKIAAVLPARMGSTRFPGKPLASLAGHPMIEHVYRRTRMSSILDSVYVATCDQEIADAVSSFGGQVIMTSDRHERASDRVAEAAEQIDAEIIVMVQGDEPMIHPEMIDESVAPLQNDPAVVCSNLAGAIRTVEEFEDRNTIKVVIDGAGDALYFSREPIPTRARLDFPLLKCWKQVCVIPFRREFLSRFASLSPTPLEVAESIDMMRALEHGYRVRMAPTAHETYAVDTPADLERVGALLARDSLAKDY
jgi:3-deoxy-manno-octulosonate cytidylyltransferase (CMP-KDO synthetase)